MSHAEGHDSDPNAYFDRLKNKIPDYDDAEEKRVIDGPEADAARTLGEGVRTDHRGFHWDDLNSPTEIPPKVYVNNGKNTQCIKL